MKKNIVSVFMAAIFSLTFSSCSEKPTPSQIETENTETEAYTSATSGTSFSVQNTTQITLTDTKGLPVTDSSGNTVTKIVLIILATILSLCFNNLGFIGLLPLISTITYILLMNIKDVIKFKYLIIFTMILWFFYDLYIKSYTSACFDFMNIVANFVSIIQINKNKETVKNG